MTNYTTGLDALNALSEVNDESTSNKAEFAKLNAGDRIVVKALSLSDVTMVYAYGNYGKGVNTFVAKEPSIKTNKGWPKEKLTPWDKAFLYHKEKSSVYNDEHGTAASTYKGKPRFAMGFYDLDSKSFIAVDLTKTQAMSVAESLKKYEAKFGKKAFELEKSTGTSGIVSLSPLDLDDLTPEQQKAFDEAPAEFDKSILDGIYYELDEKEQVDALKRVGFDVSLIGYGATEAPANDTPAEEDFPF